MSLSSAGKPNSSGLATPSDCALRLLALLHRVLSTVNSYFSSDTTLSATSPGTVSMLLPTANTALSNHRLQLVPLPGLRLLVQHPPFNRSIFCNRLLDVVAGLRDWSPRRIALDPLNGTVGPPRPGSYSSADSRCPRLRPIHAVHHPGTAPTAVVFVSLTEVSSLSYLK
uniref:(northern house mosquito) hypothetical protein n=1 Tax=Culex pipiens TaxID=7175 RepID=A0A8D8IPL8_CULPI